MTKMILSLVAALAISFPAIGGGYERNNQQSGVVGEDRTMLDEEQQSRHDDRHRDRHRGDQQSGIGDEDQQTMLDVEQESEVRDGQRDERRTRGDRSPDSDQMGVEGEQQGEELSEQQAGQHGAHGQKGQQQGKQAKQVKEFLQTAALNRIHHVNQKEIELANLALERSQSNEIKQLAREVVQDHEQVDKRIQELAQKNKMELADYQPAAYEKATADELKKLSGPQFDQAFSQVMHHSHQLVEQELEMISKEVTDPQLRQYITQQLLPKIKKHSQHSEKVRG